MNDTKLIHLLKPGAYRVWCKPPDFVPGNLTCTTFPSKTTCAACLSAFRAATFGNHRPFRVSHIPARTKC